jgi:hypothetical protein
MPPREGGKDNIKMHLQEVERGELPGFIWL